jgi:hypothetical protein
MCFVVLQRGAAENSASNNATDTACKPLGDAVGSIFLLVMILLRSSAIMIRVWQDYGRRVVNVLQEIEKAANRVEAFI